jgi:hypothetical protein
VINQVASYKIENIKKTQQIKNQMPIGRVPQNTRFNIKENDHLDEQER